MVEYIQDPIYGPIRLTDLEYDLVNTVELQRLQRLYQLHQVYVAFSGATHTRFSHAIGTLHCLDRILRESEIHASDEDWQNLRIAALLHDVGHACFSHVLEQYYGADGIEPRTTSGRDALPSHEDQTQEIILGGRDVDDWRTYAGLSPTDIQEATFVSDVLRREREGLPEAIAPLLDEKRNHGLGGLVAGTIDADNLDYIRRDAYFLGLPQAAYDDAIFAGFRIMENESGHTIGFSNDTRVIGAVEGVIRSRWYLHSRAYLHHAALAANAMLIDAAGRAIRDDAWAAIFYLSDHELLSLLAGGTSTSPGDDILVDDVASKRQAEETIRRLQRRRLPKRCYKISWDEAAAAEKPHEQVEGQSDPWPFHKLARLRGNPRALQAKRDDLIARSEPVASENGPPIFFGWALKPGTKNYFSISIERGYKIYDKEVLGTAVVDDMVRRYASLDVFYVFASESGLPFRSAVHREVAAWLGHAGSYDPAAPARGEESYAKRIERMLDLLRRANRNAWRALPHLLDGEWRTTSQLAEAVGCSRLTCGKYLNLIEAAFSAAGLADHLSKQPAPRRKKKAGRPRVAHRLKGDDIRSMLHDQLPSG